MQDVPVPFDFCPRMTEARKTRSWKVIVAYAMYGEHGGRAYLQSIGMKKRAIDSDIRNVRATEYFDFAYEVLNRYGYELFVRKSR